MTGDTSAVEESRTCDTCRYFWRTIAKGHPTRETLVLQPMDAPCHNERADHFMDILDQRHPACDWWSPKEEWDDIGGAR